MVLKLIATLDSYAQEVYLFFVNAPTWPLILAFTAGILLFVSVFIFIRRLIPIRVQEEADA